MHSKALLNWNVYVKTFVEWPDTCTQLWATNRTNGNIYVETLFHLTFIASHFHHATILLIDWWLSNILKFLDENSKSATVGRLLTYFWPADSVLGIMLPLLKMFCHLPINLRLHLAPNGNPVMQFIFLLIAYSWLNCPSQLLFCISAMTRAQRDVLSTECKPALCRCTCTVCAMNLTVRIQRG